MVVSARSGTLEGTWVTHHLVIVANALDDSLGHPVEHFVSLHDGVRFFDVGTSIQNRSVCVTR